MVENVVVVLVVVFETSCEAEVDRVICGLESDLCMGLLCICPRSFDFVELAGFNVLLVAFEMAFILYVELSANGAAAVAFGGGSDGGGGGMFSTLMVSLLFCDAVAGDGVGGDVGVAAIGEATPNRRWC